MTVRCSRCACTRQAGFSLIELMVASALGMLIVAWLTTLLVDTVRLNREMVNTNSMVERGRFAMDRLAQDARQAGYWGGYVPPFDDREWTGQPRGLPSVLPDPCLGFADWKTSPGHVDALLGLPLQLGAGLGCNAMLGAELTDAGTDVLVIRRAGACVGRDDTCTGNKPPGLYFQVSNCAQELRSGSVYALDPNSWPLTERDCSSPARLTPFLQTVYFLRRNAEGIPSLYRSEFGFTDGEPRQLAAQEMVPGVERMRVGLGVDNRSKVGAATDYSSPITWQAETPGMIAANRGDGVVDGPYIYCSEEQPCDIEDFVNTAAVRLHLLVRAQLPTAGYRNEKVYQLGDLTVGPLGDAYKRHVFSLTVAVHNVSARRYSP